MLYSPITAQPTPEQVAQRSYTLTNEVQPSWSLRAGMNWALRRYGLGGGSIANGAPDLFTSEDAARAAGERWLETGRAA